MWKKHLIILLSSLVINLFASDAFGNRPDMCRLNCTSDKCKTSEGFMNCVRTCHQSITPLMRRCVSAGLASGFKIPEELVNSYSQVIPPEHHAKHSVTAQNKLSRRKSDSNVFPAGLQRQMLSNKAAESIKAMAIISRKNLIERCEATKERVNYFTDMIKGTMFEGLLSDIIYRIDVLISHIHESPIVDAITIDNAAECRAMGTVVEDIFGKIVNSSAYHKSRVKFAKNKKFGRKYRKSAYTLGREGSDSGPSINIPALTQNQSSKLTREILRPDIMAQIRKEVREEVYRELETRRTRREQDELEDTEHERKLYSHGKPHKIRSKNKKHHRERIDLDR